MHIKFRKNVTAGLLVLLHWSCEMILWVCHCVRVSHLFRHATTITICHQALIEARVIRSELSFISESRLSLKSPSNEVGLRAWV